MPTPRETAFAIRLSPGDVTELIWRFDDAPADPALIASVTSADGGLQLVSLHGFRQIRVPYTEDELAEYPRAMRDRLRREGKIELSDSGTVGPGASLAVGAGGSVEARLEVAAGAAKGRIIVGSVSIRGAVWEEVTAPIVAVVGSGGVRVSYQPEKLRLLVAPGQTSRGIVVVPEAGVPARAAAILDSPSRLLRIESISVFRAEFVAATPEELAELPPGIREDVALHGFKVMREVASVEPGVPVDVPAQGSLQVQIEVTGPEGPPIGTSAMLTIVADRWETIRVPVLPVTSAVRVELEQDVVEIEQGGPAVPVTLVVRSRGVPPSMVDIALGDNDDPWDVSPSRISIPALGEHREPIGVSASAAAPLGRQPVALFVHWFDGLGSTFLPLTLDVRPGRAEVQVLTPRITASQGETVSATVRVTAQSAKTIRFRPAFLPAGVELLPVDRVGFAPGVHELHLSFRVDALTVAGANRRISLAWDAGDSRHSGLLEIGLTVNLVLVERQWKRPIITPPGMPLGGSVTFTLWNDGRVRFAGHMRATGALSFHFRLFAMLRSADGLVALPALEEGDVHGTFDPGSREHAWDRMLEPGFDAFLWPSLANAELTVARGTEVSGVAGGVLERVHDLVDLFAGLGVLVPLVPGGHALAFFVLAGGELRELTGVRIVGPAGTIGLITSAGAAFLLGPGVIIPVFLLTAIVADATVKHRSASDEERAFAAQVFGNTLPWDRILITNLIGLNSRPFVCPNVDGQILVNIGDRLFDAPHKTKHVLQSGEVKDWIDGQTFIHELVHAWQAAHADLDATFLARSIYEQVVDTGDPYAYGPAGPPLSSFSNEGAATLVEHWFAGRPLPGGGHAKRMSTDDEYFRYIAGNIRIGVP